MAKGLKKIGFINKLHGYKGEVVCIIEWGSIEDYEDTEFLFIKMDGLAIPFGVEEMKDKRGNAIVKFFDVNDEDYAKRLLNKEVFVETGKKENEVEVDWEDLTGYELIDDAHGSLGNIEKIEEYPQQLIATCFVNGKEVMIPLHENFLVKVDEKAKKVFLKLPEGLLDIYLK